MNNPKCGWWSGNDNHEDGCECLPYRVIFFVADHGYSIVQYPTYNAAVIGLAENFHCDTERAEEKYGWMIQFRVERLI